MKGIILAGGEVPVDLLRRGFARLDIGFKENLLQPSPFVEAIKSCQG